MEENQNMPPADIPMPPSMEPSSGSSFEPPEKPSESVSDLGNKIKSKKLSFWGFLVLLALLALVIMTVYYKVIEFRIEGEILDLKQSVERLEESLADFKIKQVQGIYIAQQAVSRLSQDELFWSEFFKKLKRETPSEVEIISYSGSEGGKISISAVTDAFDHVARIIKNLTSAPEFEHVFVTSISKGTNSEGRTVLSFPITLDYQAGVVETIEPVSQPKTPRK